MVVGCVLCAVRKSSPAAADIPPRCVMVAQAVYDIDRPTIDLRTKCEPVYPRYTYRTSYYCSSTQNGL